MGTTLYLERRDELKADDEMRSSLPLFLLQILRAPTTLMDTRSSKKRIKSV